MNILLLAFASCWIIGLTRADHGSPASSSGQDFEVQRKRPMFASCQTSGKSSSDFYWTRPDGRRVEEDRESDVYSSHENQQLLLIILDGNEVDEGEYTCWEKSRDGEMTKLDRFTFHKFEESPPWFEEPYTLVEVYESLNATLVCEALGDQPMLYSWFDQHSTLISNSRPGFAIYKRENGTELHLLHVSSNETSGVYTCFAENHLGSDSKLFRVVVNSTAGLFPPFFNKSREVVYGFESESLTLNCTAEGNPSPSYTWFDKYGVKLDRLHPLVIDMDQLNDTSEIQDFEPYSILVSRKSGSITFTKLNRTDAGYYTCYAENYLGGESKFYRLYVNASQDLFPPFFNETQEEVFGLESQSLTLVCKAEGNPTPSYLWYNKYGEKLDRFHPRVIDMDQLNDTSEIGDIKPYAILLSGKNGSITFTKLNRSDDGRYTCYAENFLGNVSKTYRLYVNATDDLFPPFFNETQVQVYGFESQSLTLDCQAEGNPRPSYIWYNKYGEKLDRFHPRVIDMDRLNDTWEIGDIKPYAILVSGKNGSITFTKLNRNDDGHYTCYARNFLGSDSKTYRLYVNATEVTGNFITVAVLNVTDTSVTFGIYASSGVRGIEARYILTDKTEAKDFYTIQWPVEGPLGEEYTVSNLLSGAKYNFQFRAMPSQNWTTLIRVELLPGPPEIIVREVASRKVKIEIFRPFYLYIYNTVDHYIIKYRTVMPVSGSTWSHSTCEVSITLPSCYGSSYEISNLQTQVYYSITVQAIGPSGSSKPSELKIFVP